jgi:hypothetical protein
LAVAKESGTPAVPLGIVTGFRSVDQVETDMIRVRILALLGAALVAMVGVFAPAAPAAAALPPWPTCYIVCDGGNPNNQGYEDSTGAFRPCNGFSTVRTAQIAGMTVELRYSTSCRMAWARGTVANGGTVRIEGFNPDGQVRAVAYASGAVNYTTVVQDAGVTARACIQPPSFSGWTCTGRY